MQFAQRATRYRFLFFGGLISLVGLLGGYINQHWPATAQSLQSGSGQPLKQPGKLAKPQHPSIVSAAQQTVVPLTSGTPQTGIINGASQVNNCTLHTTQFSIPVPAEAKRLQISLSGDQDIDLYALFGSPITNQVDFNSDSSDSVEDITITPNIMPPLMVGSYYIAITNCSTSRANFTLTATTYNGGGQITEELKTDDNSADDAFPGNGLIYINRLTPLQYPSQLQKLRIQLAAFQGLPNPTGAQIRLLAFNLPTGAPVPPTLPTLLLDRNVALPTISALRFYDFDVSELPVITGGDWYVGYQAPNPAAGVTVVLDQSSVPQGRFMFSSGSSAAFQIDVEENAMIRAVVLSGSNATAVANVSAASFSGDALAANSIVAAFGTKLATGLASANTQPLPTALLGTTVKVRDSANFERVASLFFVSPGQVNYLIPAGTANGTATVTVTGGDGSVAAGTLNIVSIAPGLLSANANGQGVAAGVVLRVKADNSQVLEPLVSFDTASNRFVAVPIDVSNPAEQVFVILFGTGFRNAGQASNLTVKIGGQDAEVSFAGAQGSLDGLDQLNVRVARALVGRGDVDLALTAGGRNANPVRINVK